MNADDRIAYLEDVIKAITSPEIEVPPGMTRSQFKIYSVLMHNRGRAVTYAQLMEALYWDVPDDAWPDPNVIAVFIYKLRKKGIAIRSIRRLGWTIDKEIKE